MTSIINKGMKTKVIDVHAHLMGMWGPEIEEKYKELMPYLSRDPDGREVIMIKGKPRTSIPHPEQIYKPTAIIQEMDKQRVDIKTLSIMPLFNYDADPDLAINYCRMQNEVLAKAVKAHPDRFVGLATVPLQDPQEAANELQRAMRELSMKGVEIGDGVNGNNLDWPKLWPFYEKAQELGAFILCHPSSPPGVERMAKYGLWNLIGFPTATSLAIASLIFGGVIEDFPRLKFCFAHGGGFVPYQIGRLDRGFRVRPDCREIIKNAPSEYFKLLYFDTITHYPPALEYLIKTVGSDHVLLGSDAPFDVADPDPVATISQLKSIPSKEKEKILGGNATKLLGIGTA
ncbi:MAG: amidohydrolase family protein [Pseudomonadota bacterium]